MRIIQFGDADFDKTPRNGWKDGEFYLVSSGGKTKRVYDPKSGDAVPDWAYMQLGAPKATKIVCVHCSKEQAETSLASKKYCVKCGRDARNLS